MLIKGFFLFLSLGVLFSITATAVEYFLWLSSTGRLVLLVLFLVLLVVLLYKYIIIPTSYLIRLRRGITNKEASLLIGLHFSEVGDKLINLLDLAENNDKSELLLASIDQRSRELSRVPFVNAIDLGEGIKHAKYLVYPMVIVGGLWLSGNFSDFFKSYERMVNYDVAYEQPAPFRFIFSNSTSSILESDSYIIQVTTKGLIRPEEVVVVIDGERFLMENNRGLFQHRLNPPLRAVTFHFESNEVRSAEYGLEVLKTPAIQTFQMKLDYPSYLGRDSDTLLSTGDAKVPEGTSVQWTIHTMNTDEISLVHGDAIHEFERLDENNFKLRNKIFESWNYELNTSNVDIKDYERLEYRLEVIKDQRPKIEVREVLDSIQPNIRYYSGEVSDDYGFKELQLVYYKADREFDRKVVKLANPAGNFAEFYYTFPTGLQLDEGLPYNYYFEIRDNDGIRGGKVSKSQVFRTTILDSNNLYNRKLKFQDKLTKEFDESLERAKTNEKDWEKLSKEQLEKKNLSFNDRQKVKSFLDKQNKQEELFEKFSKQLKETLEKTTDNDQNKLLKERLERQEKEAAKNAKLLQELEEVADKIDEEELKKKLEELGKRQQNGKRNLEQLVELTKRYYVTEKVNQLARELEKLGNKQEELAEKEIELKDKREEQQKLSEEFKNLAEELEELKKDNESLKKPLNLTIDRKEQEDVTKDQKEALDKLNEDKEEDQQSGKAGKSQKAAGKKIKKIAEGLQEAASAGGGSSITEDAEMLRQILDNLIQFSLQQEGLYDRLATSDGEVAQFSSSIRKQKELRDLFEHVDDSLFALSLRRAELSEFVNEQITEVYYNTDKALDNISERRIFQGAGYQQRVVTAANELSDFLVNILDNMESSLNPGSGGGQQGFQLPDIIKAQQSVGEKLGESGKSSGEGNDGEEGEGKGKNGKEGEKGENGGKEPNGEGQNGQGGKGGEKGEGSGAGNEGTEGLGEEALKEIYEIYKEQQRIRQELEGQLNDLLRKEDRDLAKKLIQQMEDFEDDLLENGITERSINKINTISHQLLKLENATLKQGQKEERDSKSNKQVFNGPIVTKPELLKNKSNEVEILNRQALPLQPIFQGKVRTYFQRND